MSQSLPWEVGNAFSAMIRRGRLDLALALQGVEGFEEIPVRYVPVNLRNAVRLASDFGLYAYDAYYLECALQQKAPLLTLDRRLQECAVALGISAPEVTPWKVYTYSEARQRLAQVLDEAKQTGKALIRRRDGTVFSLTPEPQGRSPFDIAGIHAEVTSEEIVALIREGRARASKLGARLPSGE